MKRTPAQTTNPRRPRAFTLIELLVVIAIISLLIGILVPALAQAKGQAQAVKCLANLRGIGLSLNLYADAYRDNFPVASGTHPWGDTWGPAPGNNPAWMEQLYNEQNISTKVYLCPSYPSGFTDYHYFLGVRAEYIRQINATGSFSFGPVNRNLIQNPGAYVLSGDSTQKFAEPDADKDDYSQDCLGFVADANHRKPYHRGALNVLFADTHAARFTKTDPAVMTFRYDTMSPW